MNSKMSTTRTSNDISRFVDAFQRHKKKAIAFIAATLLLGLAIILFFPRSYRSESKVFIQIGRESVGLDPTATVGQTVALQSSGRAEELQSAIDVLTSRGIASTVVDRLGVDGVVGVGEGDEESVHPLTASLRYLMTQGFAFVEQLDPIPPREKAIVKLEKSIEVEAEPDSAVIAVSVDAKTPQLAQTLLLTLIDAYQDEHARMHRNELSQGFFDEQQHVLRAQLVAALAKLRDAKNEMGIASIQERRINEERRLRYIGVDQFEAEQSLASAEAQVSDLRAKLDQIPKRLTTTQTNVPNTGADLLQNQLYQLEIRKLELESRYSPTHPLVEAVAQQVKEAKKVYAMQRDLRQESVDDMNPLYQELSLQLNLAETQVEAQRARRGQVLKQHEQIASVLKTLNGNEVTLDQLERDVQLASNNYSQYAESFEQSRIDNALQMQRISNLNIVQQATLSHKPVSPRKGIVAALTLMIAAFGTVFLVLGLDRLDTSLRTAEDVETELNVPVLGSLPKSSRSPLAVT